MDIKPMVYKKKRHHPGELLATGFYRRMQYWVISFGTHPCAYINIPRNSKYWWRHYDDAHDIPVNWGMTYSRQILWVEDHYEIGWFLGWDYSHYTDFVGYDIGLSHVPAEYIKWTTEKILREVYQAIDYIFYNGDINED